MNTDLNNNSKKFTESDVPVQTDIPIVPEKQPQQSPESEKNNPKSGDGKLKNISELSGEQQKKKSPKADTVKKVLKTAIPSIVVLICAIAVYIMLQPYKKPGEKINGQFHCNVSGYESNINFESNGTFRYTTQTSPDAVSGKWKLSGKTLLLSTDAQNLPSDKMYYISKDYLTFEDEHFLSGTVPQGETFNASFTAKDGGVYYFRDDGSYHIEYDSSTTAVGTYVSEGTFIAVTTDNATETYLICDSGISKVFFTLEHNE